jgi:predicted HicB family RNase H-like nuclease
VVRFLLRLPPDLHAKLVALADEDNRSLNNLIVTLLRRAVA